MQLVARQRPAAVVALGPRSLQVPAFGQQAARTWAWLPTAVDSPVPMPVQVVVLKPEPERVQSLSFSAAQRAARPTRPWPIQLRPPQAQAVPARFQRPALQLPPPPPRTANPLPEPVQTIQPLPPAEQVPVAQGCNRQRATRRKRRWAKTTCP